jgi:hypothetical protein
VASPGRMENLGLMPSGEQQVVMRQCFAEQEMGPKLRPKRRMRAPGGTIGRVYLAPGAR